MSSLRSPSSSSSISSSLSSSPPPPTAGPTANGTTSPLSLIQRLSTIQSTLSTQLSGLPKKSLQRLTTYFSLVDSTIRLNSRIMRDNVKLIHQSRAMLNSVNMLRKKYHDLGKNLEADREKLDQLFSRFEGSTVKKLRAAYLFQRCDVRDVAEPVGVTVDDFSLDLNGMSQEYASLSKGFTGRTLQGKSSSGDLVSLTQSEQQPQQDRRGVAGRFAALRRAHTVSNFPRHLLGPRARSVMFQRPILSEMPPLRRYRRPKSSNSSQSESSDVSSPSSSSSSSDPPSTTSPGHIDASSSSPSSSESGSGSFVASQIAFEQKVEETTDLSSTSTSALNALSGATGGSSRSLRVVLGSGLPFDGRVDALQLRVSELEDREQIMQRELAQREREDAVFQENVSIVNDIDDVLQTEILWGELIRPRGPDEEDGGNQSESSDEEEESLKVEDHAAIIMQRMQLEEQEGEKGDEDDEISTAKTARLSPIARRDANVRDSVGVLVDMVQHGPRLVGGRREENHDEMHFFVSRSGDDGRSRSHRALKNVSVQTDVPDVEAAKIEEIKLMLNSVVVRTSASKENLVLFFDLFFHMKKLNDHLHRRAPGLDPSLLRYDEDRAAKEQEQAELEEEVRRGLRKKANLNRYSERVRRRDPRTNRFQLVTSPVGVVITPKKSVSRTRTRNRNRIRRSPGGTPHIVAKHKVDPSYIRREKSYFAKLASSPPQFIENDRILQRIKQRAEANARVESQPKKDRRMRRPDSASRSFKLESGPDIRLPSVRASSRMAAQVRRTGSGSTGRRKKRIRPLRVAPGSHGIRRWEGELSQSSLAKLRKTDIFPRKTDGSFLSYVTIRPRLEQE